MSQFSVGDKVKINSTGESDAMAFNHSTWDGKVGTITRVDDSDFTVFVEFDMEDGKKDGHWFQQSGVSIIKSAASKNVSYCSCGGPETTVMILFDPVRVCIVCKKEKEP